jgi:hypothetical protein
MWRKNKFQRMFMCTVYIRKQFVENSTSQYRKSDYG